MTGVVTGLYVAPDKGAPMRALGEVRAVPGIKVLKEAGLLSAGRCGRNVLYCVNPEAERVPRGSARREVAACSPSPSRRESP